MMPGRFWDLWLVFCLIKDRAALTDNQNFTCFGMEIRFDTFVVGHVPIDFPATAVLLHAAHGPALGGDFFSQPGLS